MPLRFETTTLAEIERLDGGAGHAVDEAIGKVTWLGYRRQATLAKGSLETACFI